jgi:glutaconate CoA-transferase, subunit B
VSVEQAREQTGWPLRVSDDLEETEPPSDQELRELRDLRATLEAPR